MCAAVSHLQKGVYYLSLGAVIEVLIPYSSMYGLQYMNKEILEL